MGYKQKYNSVAPMMVSNKATKLGHKSSAIGMQTDPKIKEVKLEEAEDLTPRKMYTRDAAKEFPAFPEFTKTAAGDFQVKSGSGGVEAFPSTAYIGKGTSKPGVGRVFTQEQIDAGKEKYMQITAPKRKAQSWLKNNPDIKSGT